MGDAASMRRRFCVQWMVAGIRVGLGIGLKRLSIGLGIGLKWLSDFLRELLWEKGSSGGDDLSFIGILRCAQNDDTE